MLDKHVLADRVMYLLRTTYADLPKEKRPFDLAFTEVMDECNVLGEARGELKSAIGGILGARPRKPRRKNVVQSKISAPQFTFEIAQADRREVVLTSPVGDKRIVFRRAGGQVVNTAYSGVVSSLCLLRAREFAEKVFAERDREAVAYGRVRILEKSANHLLLLIADHYEAYISRGVRERAVAATVTRNGKCVAQKEVPKELWREAREIAKQYFKGAHSLPLQFS